MLNFYSGYKFEEILDMDQRVYNIMVESMKRIKARNHLILMDASQYPQIANRADKVKKHKSLFKIAYPENFESKVVTNENLRLM